MENRALQIENELRFITNRLTFDALDLYAWVTLFDKKRQLVRELLELQPPTKED